MKNKTKRIATIIFAMLIFCIGAYALGWMNGESFDPSSTYEAPARVAEIDYTTGWVTLIDWAGEAWCIRGENYELGQLVIVVFNDSNTADFIYDDTVQEVRCLIEIAEAE